MAFPNLDGFTCVICIFFFFVTALSFTDERQANRINYVSKIPLVERNILERLVRYIDCLYSSYYYICIYFVKTTKVNVFYV